MRCLSGSKKFPRFPRFPQTSLVVGGEPTPIGWNSDSYASCAIGIAVSESRSREPVRRQAAGRAARCLPHLLVSDQRCIERQRGEATQQAGIITQVQVMSRTAVRSAPFRFRDFLRSIEGHVWRAERTITPLLVSLRPRCQQCSQRRHGAPRDLQILTPLNATPSKPLRRATRAECDKMEPHAVPSYRIRAQWWCVLQQAR